MKKIITVFLFFIIVFPNIFAQTNQTSQTEEKAVEEQQKDKSEITKQVLKDIRRFEIVTLGSMPFTSMDFSLIYSAINPNGDSNITSVSPFLSLTYDESTDGDFWSSSCGQVIIGSAICSFSVGIADLIINLYKRGVFSTKRKNKDNINIHDLENDPDATKIDVNNKSSKTLYDNQKEETISGEE